MNHDFLPDSAMPTFCINCGLPKTNRHHAVGRPPTPDISEARVRRGDNNDGELQTSLVGVAPVLWPQPGTWQWKALDVLAAAGLRGLTDDDLARRLGPDHPGCHSPQWADLERAGVVRPLRDGDGRPVVRTLRSGRQAAVWVAAPDARDRIVSAQVSL